MDSSKLCVRQLVSHIVNVLFQKSFSQFALSIAHLVERQPDCFLKHFAPNWIGDNITKRSRCNYRHSSLLGCQTLHQLKPQILLACQSPKPLEVTDRNFSRICPKKRWSYSYQS